MKRWLTKRFVITSVATLIASVAMFKGKMTDSVWVYAMAVFIAGHHAEDLIKAWKGTPDAAVETTTVEPDGEVAKRDWVGTDASAS